MKNFLRAVIYTRSSGLISKQAIHHLPGDIIRTYRAPVITFYLNLRRSSSLMDCQPVVFFTCILLSPNNLSLSKKTPRWGDVHLTTGRLIRSQMLRRCSLSAIIMITHGGWHRLFVGAGCYACTGGCEVAGCCWISGCCWMKASCCCAAAGWKLVAAGLPLDES